MPSAPRVQALLGRQDVGRLRALLGDRNDVILALTDGAARVLWASAAGAGALLGCEPDDLVGRGALDHVHPGDRDWVQARFEEAASGTAGFDVVYRLHSAGRGWLSVRSIAWPLAGLRPSPALIDIMVPWPRPASPDLTPA